MGLNHFLVKVALCCVLLVIPSSSFGMDFSYDTKWDQLRMVGDIKGGDYDRFRSFLKQNLDKYKRTRFVSLSSNGGNLIEALKIAGLLKTGYAKTTTVNGKCASACFFLYLSGVARYGVVHYSPDSLKIGIHRAYFDQTYFAGLKPEDARLQQERLTKVINTILDENGVPQYLKEIMNRTSSDNMYWLSDDDLKNIGEHPAWYEELLIAKCDYSNYKKKDNLSYDAEHFIEGIDAFSRFNDCEQKIFNEQVPSLLAALAEEKTTTKTATPKPKHKHR